MQTTTSSIAQAKPDTPEQQGRARLSGAYAKGQENCIWWSISCIVGTSSFWELVEAPEEEDVPARGADEEPPQSSTACPGSKSWCDHHQECLWPTSSAWQTARKECRCACDVEQQVGSSTVCVVVIPSEVHLSYHWSKVKYADYVDDVAVLVCGQICDGRWDTQWTEGKPQPRSLTRWQCHQSL